MTLLSFDDLLPAWRALWVEAGREVSAAERLAELGVEVFCPRYLMLPPVGLRFRVRRAKLVPFLRSYVFARFDPEDPVAWHRVHDVRGVWRLIPGIAAGADLARLAAFVGDDGTLSVTGQLYAGGVVLAEPGDGCRLIEGVFAGHVGQIEEIDAQNLCASVKIYFLNRYVVVNQPLSWCELLNSRPPNRSQHMRRQRRRRIENPRGRSLEALDRSAQACAGEG
jgi:transcription antitermination factor NusG